ncbi:MAG: NTP transferase domain-containing protein [Desulfofustis sp.]|nr:NTP transferase domain-containing protein [Desulfofustis sp.]
MKIGAVILAAGLSSRMGAFKPLLELGGKTMLAHGIDVFRGCGIKSILVVAGHRGEEVQTEAQRLGVRCCHNPDFARGILSSVQVAVGNLPKLDGFFLLPVDIPLVRPVTVTALRAAFERKKVVCPRFGELRGHPPLIPARLFPEILRYDGNGGLDGLLGRQSKTLPVWDRGILLDADTADDLVVLERRWSRLAIGDPEEALALASLTMPLGGLAHGRATARVAVAIGRRLQQHGHELDLDLIFNAALLHDIAKGTAPHELRGGRLLKELGLGDLADIVAAHRDIAPPVSGSLTEKEVVGLADKLVRGSQPVTVQERFADKLARYGTNQKACRAIRTRLEKALALQEEVERRIGTRIEDILLSIRVQEEQGGA